MICALKSNETSHFLHIQTSERNITHWLSKIIDIHQNPAIFREFSFQKIYSQFSEGKNAVSFLITLSVSEKSSNNIARRIQRKERIHFTITLIIKCTSKEKFFLFCEFFEQQQNH